MKNTKLEIPREAGFVRHILTYCDGIVVGSYIDSSDSKDLDIFIPIDKWGEAAALVVGKYGKEATLNSFGGFKLNDGGLEVDVWPDKIENIIFRPQFKKAYHWKSDTLITKG